MRTYMPPKLFGTIVLLLALILVGFAQTLEEAEETAQPETVSQPAVEEKRIESLPIPPTQFEIEEELTLSSRSRVLKEDATIWLHA